jgi:hypothetical protein
MHIYLVHLKAVPTAGSEEFNSVGGAYVRCFVQANGLVEAATKAIDYVMSRKWTIEEQNDVLIMNEERASNLDVHDGAAYRRAVSEGQYSYFVAWPIQDRTDDIVEIRTLKDKDASHGSKH